MSNENVKDIYDQIFNEVYPQVKLHGRGLLYKVIQIILREEQVETQAETIKICDSLGIKPNAYREDDNKIIDDLVDVLFVDRQTVIRDIPGRELWRSMSKRINQQFSDNEKMEEMKWIIVGACTVVGIYFCVQYLKRVKQQKLEREQRIREGTRQHLSPPIPAALCLVVPAKMANILKIGSILSATDVKHFIDNASYFLCTRAEEANSNERRLELLSDETISHDSNREVYIRVDISDGRDLIDKEIPYMLKTNLPTKEQFTIKQLACLKNLSGIEKFNRV